MYEFTCDNNLCLTTTTFVNGMDATRMIKILFFFFSPAITEGLFKKGIFISDVM